MDWINIKERLPSEEENVILFDGTEVFCGHAFNGYEGRQCYGNQTCDGVCYGWYNKNEITHWMPLPKPPKGDE